MGNTSQYGRRPEVRIRPEIQAAFFCKSGFIFAPSVSQDPYYKKLNQHIKRFAA
jgi:hypothetical protein